MILSTKERRENVYILCSLVVEGSFIAIYLTYNVSDGKSSVLCLAIGTRFGLCRNDSERPYQPPVGDGQD